MVFNPYLRPTYVVDFGRTFKQEIAQYIFEQVYKALDNALSKGSYTADNGYNLLPYKLLTTIHDSILEYEKTKFNKELNKNVKDIVSQFISYLDNTTQAEKLWGSKLYKFYFRQVYYDHFRNLEDDEDEFSEILENDNQNTLKIPIDNHEPIINKENVIISENLNQQKEIILKMDDLHMQVYTNENKIETISGDTAFEDLQVYCYNWRKNLFSGEQRHHLDNMMIDYQNWKKRKKKFHHMKYISFLHLSYDRISHNIIHKTNIACIKSTSVKQQNLYIHFMDYNLVLILIKKFYFLFYIQGNIKFLGYFYQYGNNKFLTEETFPLQNDT
ncbi:hypothetical protein C1645_361746 [Glomus cerebriforme]|uniref:Uncharacterized protein n=1 Tax=Glomus cerebriforme TaxID=658196 RepID=A0A397TFG0_9GLOM|nr:hypothetical protein C1645_361746 [Glomus cerebriforme]